MSDQIGITSHRSNSTFIMVYEDVWQELKHDATALVVYMALARRTHQGNNTWYSTRRRMADEAGVSVTTFKDKTKILVSLGLVEVKYRYQDPGTGEMSDSFGGRFTDQKGNLYTVRDHLPHPRQNLTPTPSESDPHPVENRPHPRQNLTPNIDPLHRSQTQIPNISSSVDEPGQPDGFKDFWDNYPRKIGKGKAEEKYKEQLQATTPDVLVNAVKNFAAECRIQQTEKRYIPYPSTWLNQGRWKDYDVAPPAQDTSRQETPDFDMDQILSLIQGGEK